LTNNSAINGGGIAFGTIRNSFIARNAATNGGGTYHADVFNCTIAGNQSSNPSGGAGTYNGRTRNSLVFGNAAPNASTFNSANFYPSSNADYAYCAVGPFIGSLPSAGNIVSGQLTVYDSAGHVPAVSPVRGKGSSQYASGVDNDGEAWADPPSIGCDEVVDANLIGPLSVSIFTVTNASSLTGLVNRRQFLWGLITGRIARIDWSFGDGTVLTNTGSSVSHVWTNVGDYALTCTVFNLEHPEGVAASVPVQILPLMHPVLDAAVFSNGAFQFEFSAQEGAEYTIQYATNLLPPINWRTLQRILYSDGGITQITDGEATNVARFYRVLAQ
jgi:hypothetical protein